VKDGCSPQGQCGCCTVWVDGSARVSCVTALRRVAGRGVTTTEGLSPALQQRWADAFVSAGASQCGFCTPGIVLRLAALSEGRRPITREAIETALLAHLCRCTGWQSIVEAGCVALGIADPPPLAARDPLLASWRAQIEGPMFQTSGPEVVLGGGGFADDSAPSEALVQLGAEGQPAENLAAARQDSGKVQGRNSTVPLTHPVPLPEGDWTVVLQTTWVEPAYVEPDASWSAPGQPPFSPLANGGAFGGKRRSPVTARARTLADEHDRPIRVVWTREDVVRHGPKRPPLALGLRADGHGVLRVGVTPGSGDLSPLFERVRRVAPNLEIEPYDIVGPPVAADLRGAGWMEVLAALQLCDTEAEQSAGLGRADVTLPGGGRAAVAIDLSTGRGTIEVEVWAGEVLDSVTLRSYVLGAVHQSLGMVWSEGIAVDADGVPQDLTIRSFGIITARDMPQVKVTIHEGDTWPVNGSDAVFVAAAAAAWMAEGRPPRWPTRRGTGPHSSLSLRSERREEHT